MKNADEVHFVLHLIADNRQALALQSTKNNIAILRSEGSMYRKRLTFTFFQW